VIRVGVQYSKTFYYTVNGVQHGVAYEIGQEFEKYLNRKYPQANKNLKIHVVFMVTPRDQAGQRLLNGTLDIIASGVKVTPERQKIVDFSEPAASGVNEIVVTAPSGPAIASVDDLAGKNVYARKTSSYWEHLQGLNDKLQKEGKPAIQLQAVPDDLGDEDLLEIGEFRPAVHDRRQRLDSQAMEQAASQGPGSRQRSHRHGRLVCLGGAQELSCTAGRHQ
jgi:ABC-type amino acid transport substrate-binding protein